MTDDRRLTMSRKAAALGGVALLLVGAGIAYLLVRSSGGDGLRGTAASHATVASSAQPSPRAAAPSTPAGASSDAPLPDVDVTLTEEMVARAGIEVAPAGTSGGADALTIPGVIEADAYRRVVVTSLAAGRITRVNAELGQPVKRGATLALIYSPGLAEAQTRYLSMRAELGAAVQEMTRTERLVEIGAASRQELERIRASHSVHATGVEGARAQLVLLGMSSAAVGRLTSPSQISATISVPAPIDGVITERQANPGLNVDTSTPLFTVVDLSQMWVQGDLYEKDFPRVRVGSPAMITTTAYPGLALGGRVAYIDPQLNEQTRTARVRVEVPNPRRELRLGMFAEMRIGAQDAPRVVTVAREAVQTVGDRHVVYLARSGQSGRFIEREVRVGEVSGNMVEITSGVNPGDVVVTKGSFFVRAERERLGLRAPGGNAPAAMGGMPGMSMDRTAAPPASAKSAPAGVTKITVSDDGFEPARLEVQKVAVITLEFTRVSEKTCATEVVIPSQQIRKALPLNVPVKVELGRTEAGEIAFACGMNMLRGTVVVR